jgi:cold shock CspA family protein
MRIYGTLLFFNQQKCFGQIKGQDGELYFAHRRNFAKRNEAEIRPLGVGTELQFDVHTSENFDENDFRDEGFDPHRHCRQLGPRNRLSKEHNPVALNIEVVGTTK